VPETVGEGLEIPVHPVPLAEMPERADKVAI